MTKKYVPARKSGRCANGFENGSGVVTHWVELLPSNLDTAWRALCGVEPGRRSAGWSVYETAMISCPRCIKRMEKLLEAELPPDELRKIYAIHA